jgi:hypothetical protein
MVLRRLKTFIVIYGVLNARPFHKYYAGDVNPPTNANKCFIHKISGLFHRSYMMSGSAYSSWALVDDPVHYAVQLASSLNCSIPRYVDTYLFKYLSTL